MPFISKIHPHGVLSFADGAPEIPLEPLNILIGPNGSGKSNLIEIFELLKATPTDLASAIRMGGGVGEWLWKGASDTKAYISAEIQLARSQTALHYLLVFEALGGRLEIFGEDIKDKDNEKTYYSFAGGMIRLREGEALPTESIDPRQSVLSQRKDPHLYPELTDLGRSFSRIQTFREWCFGRLSPVRQPQRTDLPNDVLLPDARNLGLILNAIHNSDASVRLNEAIHRFLPRFSRLVPLVQGGTVQIFLHEEGLGTPVPATRLSDGTLRFIALLAILLKPDDASLICIEEPELGLHPDALAIVAEFLSEASQRTQIVVTTQSDILVSALSDRVESVVVCENQSGASQFERLASDKLQFWLKKYQLGEIWRMGEIGGNL